MLLRRRNRFFCWGDDTIFRRKRREHYWMIRSLLDGGKEISDGSPQIGTFRGEGITPLHG